MVGEALIKLFKEYGAQPYRGAFCTRYTLPEYSLGISHHGTEDSWFIDTTEEQFTILSCMGYQALDRDATEANLETAKVYLHLIRRFAQKFGRFTAQDLYSSTQMYDIPMYLALQALVEAGELVGIGPYEHEPLGAMSELVYEVSEFFKDGPDAGDYCRICQTVLVGPHDDVCEGCKDAEDERSEDIVAQFYRDDDCVYPF